MFTPIFVCVILTVCPVIAITFPNGFTFDETQYSNTLSRVATVPKTCDQPYGRCSDDCSTFFDCDGNNTIVANSSFACDTSSPYCPMAVGTTMCLPNFPMSNPACLSRALENFVCTADGQFPDPTDCTKYHICNGTGHNIVECPANHMYRSDPSMEYTSSNPGNGEYSCRFASVYESCSCQQFYCSMKNDFDLSVDFHHYAYCFDNGSIRKTLMFKCPNGTSHSGSVSNTTNFVECLPPPTERS